MPLRGEDWENLFLYGTDLILFNKYEFLSRRAHYFLWRWLASIALAVIRGAPALGLLLTVCRDEKQGELFLG